MSRAGLPLGDAFSLRSGLSPWLPFPKGRQNPWVFYAAEAIETAIAELAFYRMLFFVESPDTQPPEGAADYTAFSVALDVDRMLDLTALPLSADEALWSDPVDYTACQGLADAARGADVAVLRYWSVRDPARGANLAVLDCRAFAWPAPLWLHTWKMRIGPVRVQALCDFPRASREFAIADFAADPLAFQTETLIQITPKN